MRPDPIRLVSARMLNFGYISRSAQYRPMTQEGPQSPMDIVSPPALIFLVFIIAGLVAASTRVLGRRQRVVCVIVSLVVPVVGGLGVMAYVFSKRRQRSRSQQQISATKTPPGPVDAIKNRTVDR
jgi:hypothetical protein